MTAGALHEALRELFATRPDLVARLISPVAGPAAGPFVPLSTEQTAPKMKRLLPDAVFATPSAKAPRGVFVIEVQLWISEAKRRVWVHYLGSAHDRYDCGVELIVITPFAEVARWAAKPIWFGHGNVIVPRVIGPSSVPWVTEEEAKRAPALAVLSTLSHLDDPRSAEQALWTFEALAGSMEDAEGRLADILEAGLTDAIRERMEALMRAGNYEYQSEFARKYFARGREEGREEGREQGEALGAARALLVVLRSREFVVDAALEGRILAQRDADQLEAWLGRAATAPSLEAVFEG